MGMLCRNCYWLITSYCIYLGLCSVAFCQPVLIQIYDDDDDEMSSAQYDFRASDALNTLTTQLNSTEKKTENS